jgi:hypothetical protein
VVVGPGYQGLSETWRFTLVVAEYMAASSVRTHDVTQHKTQGGINSIKQRCVSNSSVPRQAEGK